MTSRQIEAISANRWVRNQDKESSSSAVALAVSHCQEIPRGGLLRDRRELPASFAARSSVVGWRVMPRCRPQKFAAAGFRSVAVADLSNRKTTPTRVQPPALGFGAPCSSSNFGDFQVIRRQHASNQRSAVGSQVLRAYSELAPLFGATGRTMCRWPFPAPAWDSGLTRARSRDRLARQISLRKEFARTRS